jgi:hypothetical protein
VNVCSGSTLTNHHFNSKIVDSFYSTSEEKSIVSFYHLYHKINPNLISLPNKTTFMNTPIHPISSFGVISRSTREISYVGKFQSKINHPVDPNGGANEPETAEIQENEENEGNPIDQPDVQQNRSQDQERSIRSETGNTGSRQGRVQLREYLEKLKKKNPFKEVNVIGMRMSPCGRKVVAGYCDEHLKFWEMFQVSKNSRSDLSLALLSEWR